MIFAALVAAPASAFLCGRFSLLFFLVFPAAALTEMRFRYFRNLAFMVFAPLLVFLWAWYTGNHVSAERSLRWICSLSAGVYFAVSLGPGRIAAVVRSISGLPPFQSFSDMMMLAGGTSAAAVEMWKKHSSMVFKERLFATVRDAVAAAEPKEPEPVSSGTIPFVTAVIAWVFLLVSVSGRAS